MSAGAMRPILAAEILSIGTELTVGETRDTNAGELARSLTELGVEVRRLSGLPDVLALVQAEFAAGLGRADLVVSTGGLGPTPDDLTREAIAATVTETPVVDPALEAWLRGLWDRRGMAFPEINLKQAWLVPSATAIPNENGTAPGWWVERPDGRLIVSLPGPPREMRPMWDGWVVPRLSLRGQRRDTVSRTYRLSGIGESAVADLLGEALLRATNPVVATYARSDAVDVRISATAVEGHTAEELVDGAERPVLAALAGHVWATGSTTWSEAIAARLEELGWTLATWETGTGGALIGLLGSMERLVQARVEGRIEATVEATGDGPGEGPGDETPEAAAVSIRTVTGATVGLAVRAASRGADTTVSVAVATADGVHRERRVAFLGGSMGRSRAALTAAAILLERLRDPGRLPDPARLGSQ